MQGHADPNVTLKVYAHVYDRKRKDEAVGIALAGVRRDAVGREVDSVR